MSRLHRVGRPSGAGRPNGVGQLDRTAAPGRPGGAARWVGPLGLAALTALLATGCGIRPTAIPVDAGAPASRTACPTPLQVPAAASSPAMGVVITPGHPLPGTRGTRPTARPTGTASTPAAAPAPIPAAAGGITPGGSLFSAVPTATPSPSTLPTCG